MPPIVLSIIALINAAAASGPQVAKLMAQARDLFAMLFRGGIITVEQQEKLKSWADEHERAVLAGEIPPALQVEPDPT